jgi:hypothetical protein
MAASSRRLEISTRNHADTKSKHEIKMKKVAAVLIMLAAPCAAQTTVPGQPIVPLGFCQMGSSALGSAAKLSANSTIPVGATMVYLQAESANVRYREDSAAPTTAIGNLILSGNSGIFYNGSIKALQFIAVFSLFGTELWTLSPAEALSSLQNSDGRRPSNHFIVALVDNCSNHALNSGGFIIHEGIQIGGLLDSIPAGANCRHIVCTDVLTQDVLVAGSAEIGWIDGLNCYSIHPVVRDCRSCMHQGNILNAAGKSSVSYGDVLRYLSRLPCSLSYFRQLDIHQTTKNVSNDGWILGKSALNERMSCHLINIENSLAVQFDSTEPATEENKLFRERDDFAKISLLSERIGCSGICPDHYKFWKKFIRQKRSVPHRNISGKACLDSKDASRNEGHFAWTGHGWNLNVLIIKHTRYLWNGRRYCA